MQRGNHKWTIKGYTNRMGMYQFRIILDIHPIYGKALNDRRLLLHNVRVFVMHDGFHDWKKYNGILITKISTIKISQFFLKIHVDDVFTFHKYNGYRATIWRGIILVSANIWRVFRICYMMKKITCNFEWTTLVLNEKNKLFPVRVMLATLRWAFPV